MSKIRLLLLALASAAALLVPVSSASSDPLLPQKVCTPAGCKCVIARDSAIQLPDRTIVDYMGVYVVDCPR